MSTRTLELPTQTYERLVAIATEQQLEVETLIENFLKSLELSGGRRKHRFDYLLEIADDLGIEDLSENHDHYFHGAVKG